MCHIMYGFLFSYQGLDMLLTGIYLFILKIALKFTAVSKGT